MSNLPVNSNKLQPVITVLPCIPSPKYAIGAYVNAVVRDYKGCEETRIVTGQIIGIEYLSRDAALVMQDYPGWTYTLEMPAFTTFEVHIHVGEEQIEGVVLNPEEMTLIEETPLTPMELDWVKTGIRVLSRLHHDTIPDPVLKTAAEALKQLIA